MEIEIIPAMVIRIKWKLEGLKWKQNGNGNYFHNGNITGLNW